MHNSAVLFLLPAGAILLATAAIAQTAATGQDEIRDPEVSLPAQPPTNQPCVVDAAILQDTRINRDVLRVMQTSPYFAHTNNRRRIARIVTVNKSSGDTWVDEKKYRSLGCGFYVEDTVHKLLSANYSIVNGVLKYGSYESVTVGTALFGPGGELFSESKSTSPTGSETKWSQMTSLEAFGSEKPAAVDNRYGKREAKKTHFYTRGKTLSAEREISFSNSLECEVTGRRSASEFHPRLTGDAFIKTCSYESYDADHQRSAQSGTSLSFPDSPAVPDLDPAGCSLEWRAASRFHSSLAGDAIIARCRPRWAWVYLLDKKLDFELDKCRLEARAARDFHRNLQGTAYVVRCGSAGGSKVYFPELEETFDRIDSIDGSFKSDLSETNLLTEIELVQ